MRALFWSISSFTTLFFSFQSRCVNRMFGLARITPAISLPMRRSSSKSGPLTRKATGYGTGGPFCSGWTRPRTREKSVSMTSSMRFWRRSRPPLPFAVTMNSTRFVLSSCWSSGR